MTTLNKNTAPDWGRSAGIHELWTEILPGLCMGGTADRDTLENSRDIWSAFDEGAEITTDDFDAVVTMYAFARPVDWNVEELRWGIYDGPGGVDLDTLHETVLWAHKRWHAGKRVLIRCQAGLSRSGMVTALVLMEDDGYSAQDAIDKLRRTRTQQILQDNGTFRQLVYKIGREGW